MKAASIKKVLILVTILAVPGFLYYLLQEKGKNRYKPLPFFGPKQVAGTFHSVRGEKIPDTVYHIVRDFKFVNQNGDSVSSGSYSGKILILNLFYTNNHSNASMVANNAMKKFNTTYGHNRAINFISLSIDPARDNPQVLNEYSKLISAKPGKWDLLTGDSTQLYNMINKGLFLDAHQDEGVKETKLIYSNLFVLLDMHQRIRGYYDATSHEAMSKLDDEIKVLLAEELRNIKDGR